MRTNVQYTVITLKIILMNEQENNGAEDSAETEVHPGIEGTTNGQNLVTTEEKAQYEVFRNGDLPRETISGWITNDLKAIMSFVHGCLNDPQIREPLIDAYYARYKKLHAAKKKEE